MEPPAHHFPATPPPSPRGPQSKFWVFTLNNPKVDVDTSSDKVRHSIHQLECGESGTYHYQGFVIFQKPVRRQQVINILGIHGAHVEKRSDNSTNYEAWRYCIKEDTRIAGPWSKGIGSIRLFSKLLLC